MTQPHDPFEDFTDEDLEEYARTSDWVSCLCRLGFTTDKLSPYAPASCQYGPSHVVCYRRGPIYLYACAYGDESFVNFTVFYLRNGLRLRCRYLAGQVVARGHASAYARLLIPRLRRIRRSSSPIRVQQKLDDACAWLTAPG